MCGDAEGGTRTHTGLRPLRPERSASTNSTTSAWTRILFAPLREMKTTSSTVPIARNRRARFDYHILDTWEAGLVLTGTEVKSLRTGRAQLNDAYGIVEGGQVYLLNMHIAPYAQGSYNNHEPTRTRKVLLHRREIRRLIGGVEREGLTLVPLDLYFKNGVAKVTLALAKGKKVHDKRQAMRERDAARELARAARSR